MVGEIPYIRNEPPDSTCRDASYLRFLTRKLLLHVENVINLSFSGKTEQLKQLEESHALIFGKASVVNSLATLAELLTRLNQLPEIEGMKVAEERTASSLTEYDITLIKHYLKKQHTKTTMNLSDHTQINKQKENNLVIARDTNPEAIQ
jgi:hypothetical protein